MNIGSGNGLVPNRRQAITWAPESWPKSTMPYSVSMAHNELQVNKERARNLTDETTLSCIQSSGKRTNSQLNHFLKRLKLLNLVFEAKPV